MARWYLALALAFPAGGVLVTGGYVLYQQEIERDKRDSIVQAETEAIVAVTTALSRHDTKLAASRLAEIARTNPNLGGATMLHMYGTIYMHEGRYGAADEAFSGAIAKDPKKYRPYLGRVSALAAMAEAEAERNPFAAARHMANAKSMIEAAAKLSPPKDMLDYAKQELDRAIKAIADKQY